MDEIDNDGTQEPHQDVQDRDEDYHPMWLVKGIFLMLHWA